MSTFTESTLFEPLSSVSESAKNLDWENFEKSAREVVAKLAGHRGEILSKKEEAGWLIKQTVQALSVFAPKKDKTEITEQVLQGVWGNFKNMIKEFQRGKNNDSLESFLKKSTTKNELNETQFVNDLINKAAEGVFLETIRDLPIFLRKWAGQKPVEFVATLGLKLDALKAKIIYKNNLSGERAAVAERFFSNDARVKEVISAALEWGLQKTSELQKAKGTVAWPADFGRALVRQVQKNVVESIKKDLEALKQSVETPPAARKIAPQKTRSDKEIIARGEMIRGIEKEIRNSIDPKKLAFITPYEIKTLAKEKLRLDEGMNAVIKLYLEKLSGEGRSNFLERVKAARTYYQKEMDGLLESRLGTYTQKGFEGKLELAKTWSLETFKILVRNNLNTQEPLHPISSKKKHR